MDTREVRDAIQEPIAQHRDAGAFFGKRRFGYRASGAHADNLMRGQGTGAKTALVPAAVHECLNPNLRRIADVEHADPLRCVELMPRKRHQIDAQCGGRNRDLAQRLRSIDVQ